MSSRLRKLREMPLEELRVRAEQWAAARVERVALRARTARWSDAAPALPPWPLRSRAGEEVAVSDLETALREDAGENGLAGIHALASAAAGVRVGRVPLLGHGHVVLGDPPDWHREPIGRQRAPRVHWSRVPYLDASVVGDHKALWEPNRLQYLLALAVAWRLERRDGDLACVHRHLESWLTENPPGLGVNWASSLEVAYRAIAWCWLRRLLLDAPWPEPLLRRSTAALAHHARHVERHLSLYFSPNTHLTGEALGLCYVGTALAGHPLAGRWRRLGAAILERELERQVYPDGQHFEQALLYHRYTAEIYLHYLRLAESGGWPLVPAVRERLGSLLGLLRAAADANGHVPLIGDDDGGSLLPLDDSPPHDVRGLLLAGAVALDRLELAIDASAPLLTLALCGREATSRLEARLGTMPVGATRLYPTGGLAVLRDGWQHDSAVAVIDAGRHGALNCGHAHADALSMTLSLGPEPLFVDRGTFTYVGPERNEYRATSAHNTLEIDGTSSVTPIGPFQWAARPARPWACLQAGRGLVLLDAVAEGHADTPRKSRHRRTVLHVHGSGWLVLDRGERAGARAGTVRWQLAPGLDAAETVSGGWEVRMQGGAVLACVLIGAGGQASARFRDVSPRYGARVPATVLEIETGPDLVAATLVIPGSERPPGLGAAGSGAWQWSDPQGHHRLMASRDGPGTLAAEGWSLQARAAWWLRRESADELLLVVDPVAAMGFPPGLFDYSGAPGERVRAVERTAAGWAPAQTTVQTTDQT